MKNQIILCFSLLALSNIASASESMAIFSQPNQTIVVINEMQSEFKLKELIDAFGSKDQINITSNNGDISLQCKTASGAASCTVKLKKSSEVEISGQQTFVYSESINTTGFRVKNVYSQIFQNPQGDKFNLFVGFFQLVVQADKK